MSRIWFVTGASRGFGLEICRAALAAGYSVVATARRPDEIALPDDQRTMRVALDVTDADTADAAVEAAQERFGRVDVCVNNAGYGLVGAVEEVDDDEARALFDVNVFGLLNVTRAVLPGMREAGSGRIINLSSVAGIASGPGSGIYSASKYAVEGISEAQRQELEPLGIFVTVVEPGVFRTDFLDPSSLRTAAATIDDYAATDRRGWAESENHRQTGDPAKAAAAILELARSPEPPLRLPLGADCVERIEAKLARFRSELDTWWSVSTSTGGDEGEAR